MLIVMCFFCLSPVHIHVRKEEKKGREEASLGCMAIWFLIVATLRYVLDLRISDSKGHSMCMSEYSASTVSDACRF